MKSILTKQEKKIVGHLMKGLQDKEIALIIDVEKNTVKAHCKNIFKKLQVSNRTQAAILAYKNPELLK